MLTFSVGFGKPLLQKMGKDGVRYVLAAIPLGGYVKMLDERDEQQQVLEKDKPFAFNQKSVWVRIAIVLAGPVANFILAILLYWFMFTLGIKGLTPEIGVVPEASIAEQAGLKKGDTIVRIDGSDINEMDDVSKSLAKRLGEKTYIDFQIERKGESQPIMITMNIAQWKVDDEKPEILHSLGIYHPIENLGILIGSVNKNEPAEKAGIKVGDKIISVAGEMVSSWQAMQPLISSKPNKEVLIEVERQGERISFLVVIGSTHKKEKAADSGFIGIGSSQNDFKQYIVIREASILESLELAIYETAKMVSLTSKMFLKLITGEISTKSLSGPVSIAKGAGNSASIGLVYFISFLAMISVNLGFINLLPVPMLDGGHLLYFIIEAVKGEPLSQKVQEFGLQIGMMLVFALMAIAIFNDISRF